MAKREFLPGTICSLAVVVVLIGCSSGPSDRQARDDLQIWFENRWPRAVLVLEYEALNKERESGKYVIAYKAKARFIKDVDGCVRTCCGDVCIDRLVAGFRWITKESNDPRVVRKGDLFETQGKNTYTKTGKGWSCENL